MVPLLLDGARDERAIAEMRRRGDVAVFDTIALQVGELLRCRNPARKTVDDAQVREVLGDAPERYGTWVHYPWSNRLVHVLPRAEYFELRSSRNRNKITTPEQAKLAGLKIGIVGLSVGQATALALTLEGIGSEIRLADHDKLALSNLNRLRAGIHEIGTNKAIITAHAIWEIDPYLDLVILEDGIREENLTSFLDGIDLLFEECDDLAMKIRLREEARKRRIIVLMETSDRGMLDVERFDLEPERPLLHGLIGDVDSHTLQNLSTAEKVPFVLKLIGHVSPRAAASLVDIDATLETWPQLASAVSLGAAINTDCARRIVLGSFRQSGRFYVDLERIIGQEEEDDPPIEPPKEILRTSTPPRSITPEIETIVRYASLAPSGGNCQPWRFVHRPANRELECWHARERSESMLDFEGRAAHLALGAALENARLACCKLGLNVSFERLPGGPAWKLLFGTGELQRTPDDDVLLKTVELRVTNRKLAERQPLPRGFDESLALVASRAGASLDVITDPKTIEALGEIVARSEKLRMLHPVLHKEMIQEVRWSPEDAQRTGDGIDVATLELGAADAAGLNLLRSGLVVRTIRSVGGGDGLKKSTRKAVASSSAIALVRFPGSDLSAYLRGGEAVQRIWLYANACGVAFQPMTAILYLLARAESGGDGFDDGERAELAKLRTDLDSVFGAHAGAEIMLFRLAISGPPTARSLRRPIEAILSLR